MTKSVSDTVQRWLSDLPRGLREHIHRVEEISKELARAHQTPESVDTSQAPFYLFML